MFVESMLCGQHEGVGGGFKLVLVGPKINSLPDCNTILGYTWNNKDQTRPQRTLTCNQSTDKYQQEFSIHHSPNAQPKSPNSTCFTSSAFHRQEQGAKQARYANENESTHHSVTLGTSTPLIGALPTRVDIPIYVIYGANSYPQSEKL